MRTTRQQVIDWLFPRVRKNILTLLLADGERRWHLRDVVRRTSCAIGSVRRELKGLVACGLATESRDGNRTYYQANRACPVYPELVALIRKTSGLADVLRTALETLGGQIRVAFVYGSLARQEARAGSDVDLMVIGQARFGQVVSALTGAQETIGREINPTVYSPREFRKKVSTGHHFVQTVMASQKIFLIGDGDELGRLAK